ncbi:MAG: hypothetical protein A2X86_18835 [Bdellovibrionales bacterium GWA2_49_15]|nr:MAG: hypothetical protein A2X86_18835 [Bdellovibrionales bacterium GWA2_49_15]HAZ14283.1 hypothetical protein [Bdellovibrionales bacterium]
MTALGYFNGQSRKINGIQVLLDISSEQKILNVQVKSSPKINEILQNLLVGQGLDAAMTLSPEALRRDDSFIVLELELLQEAILKFVGVLLPDALEKGRPPQELVCRCFGVYQSDIDSFIRGKELSNVSLVHLTEELNAGAACGSCLEELKYFLEQGKQKLLPFPPTASVDASGKRLRIKGLTPKELAELLSEKLPDKSIEVLLVRPPFVLVRSKRGTLSSAQLAELGAWAKEKLLLPLEFRS